MASAPISVGAGPIDAGPAVKAAAENADSVDREARFPAEAVAAMR